MTARSDRRISSIAEDVCGLLVILILFLCLLYL